MFFWTPDLLVFWKKGGQITCLTDREDTFRRAGNPGKHAGEHAESERYRYDRSEPVHVEDLEVVVETNEQALDKIDVFSGDDHSEGVGAQNEDEHGDERSAEHRFGIVDRRILDVAHVDARHLHARIE